MHFSLSVFTVMYKSRAGEGLTLLPIKNQHPGTKDLMMPLSTSWSFSVLFSSEILQRDTFSFSM